MQCNLVPHLSYCRPLALSLEKTIIRQKINIELMKTHDKESLKNRNFVKLLDYIVIVSFLLVININKLYASNFSENKSDTCTCKLQIIKVESTKEAYLIFAIIEKDSSQIVMVSLKSRNKQGESIKIGNSYLIKLYPYYDQDIFPDHMLIFDVIISRRKVMVPSNGWASNVYTSPDLSGLRILANVEEK